MSFAKFLRMPIMNNIIKISRDGVLITIEFCHILRITILHSTQ